MSYKSPTLTEIYAEFFLTSGALSGSDLIDICLKLRDAEFVEPEFVQHIHSGEPGEIAPKIRVWDSNKQKLVQLTDRFIALNLTKTYPGWENFRNTLREMIEIVEETVDKFEPLSCSLHTIDRFEVSKDGYQLGNWLNCDGRYIPTWYQDSDEACDISIGKGQINQDKFNRAISVTVRRKELQFQVMINSHFWDTLSNGQDIYVVIEKLHDEANMVFEGIITDNLREEIMGGVIVKDNQP